MSAPRPYTTSFWACCSPFDLCLKTCCCSCFVFGSNHHRIKTGGVEGYESCNGPCVGFCALSYCGLGWVLQFLDKEKMREHHNLEGDTATSCLGTFCCPCCELVQTKKELDYVAINQDPSKAGYHAQPGMVAQPQVDHQAPPPFQGQPQAYHGHDNNVNGANYSASNGAHSQDAIMPQQIMPQQSYPAPAMGMNGNEKTPTGHNIHQ